MSTTLEPGQQEPQQSQQESAPEQVPAPYPPDAQETTPLPESVGAGVAAGTGGVGGAAASDAVPPDSGTVPPAFGGPAGQSASYPAAYPAASDPAASGPAAPGSAEPSRPRHGGLIAGIAVGALIGALVGGGTAAVVSHNTGNQTVVQAEKPGTLTLNNLDSATAISGVATVATPSVVTLQVSSNSASGTGSGVIYSADGYIITNAHVATLEGATANPQIEVQLNDGSLLQGKLVGSDPFADIAVVKVDAKDLTPIQVADSDEINVGDLAIAIGAPLSLSNTVTSGVVSALDRGISVASSMLPDTQTDDQSQGGDQGGQEGQDQQGSPFPWFQFENPNGEGEQQQPQMQSANSRVAIPVIQTDASINPGNSGGALLNANGELIGINVALASATADSGAAGSDGLGFAVPSNFATRVADALIAGEQPTHGLLGVTQTTEAGSTTHAGGVIGEVTPGSPADEAGLKSGDVITSVNGAPADSFTTVTALVRMQAGGSEITIGYNRNGQQHETKVTLGTLDW